MLLCAVSWAELLPAGDGELKGMLLCCAWRIGAQEPGIGQMLKCI